MFEIYIIDSKRNFFQNALKLFKMFKSYFENVYIISGIGIDNQDRNLINCGNHNFVNAFNEVIRNVSSKYCIFVDSSLIIPNINFILQRLNFFKEILYDKCGSYAFHTEGFKVPNCFKKEIFSNVFQVNYHNLDFFIIDKSILLDIGLVTCIPNTNGEGLEFLISWINLKNKKVTILDEFFYFNRLFCVPKNHESIIRDQRSWFFDQVKHAYDLNEEFFSFYKSQLL